MNVTNRLDFHRRTHNLNLHDLFANTGFEFKEKDMGNPAGDRKKQREKRRKKLGKKVAAKPAAKK